MIRAIKPFMNGELPIRSPVSGIAQRRARRQRQQAEDDQNREKAQAPRTSVRAIRRRKAPHPASCRASRPWYSPRRGSIDRLRNERHEDRQENDRRDGEPEIRRQADRLVGVDQVDRVVGELDEHRIERLDQHVHGEGAGDRGKAQRQPGERMSADAEEGRARRAESGPDSRHRPRCSTRCRQRPGCRSAPSPARPSPACESAPSPGPTPRPRRRRSWPRSSGRRR